MRTYVWVYTHVCMYARAVDKDFGLWYNTSVFDKELNMDNGVASYKEAIKQWMGALKKLADSSKGYEVLTENKIIKVADGLYGMLYGQIHERLYLVSLEGDGKAEKEIREWCKRIRDKVVPIIDKRLELTDKQKRTEVNVAVAGCYQELQKKFYRLVAFRDLEFFALRMESDRPRADKVWVDVKEIAGGYLRYATDMVLGDAETGDSVIELIRLHCPTGYFKSFALNLTAVFQLGVNPNARVGEVTGNQELVSECANNVVKMLCSEEFSEIFPVYKEYKSDMFSAKTISMAKACSFSLTASRMSRNYTIATADGFPNGIRLDLFLSDDLTRGEVDSENRRVHTKIVKQNDTVWCRRADGENKQKRIYAGTMWCDFDLLNVVRDRVAKHQKILPSKKYKYTEISENGRNVFITVPYLDYETDESTYPRKYSTEKARYERDNIYTPHQWWAICQGRPLPPEGLCFEYDRLKTYDTIPEYGNTYYAFLDPSKTGKNYLTLGVFKKCGDLFYLVNVIYRLSDYEREKYTICDMLARYNVFEFGYEANSDFSMKTDIKGTLSGVMTLMPTILSYYSTENKQDKIFRARNYILDKIVFPRQGLYAKTSEFGTFMEHFTTYSEKNAGRDITGLYDDAPDMLAMFILQFERPSYSIGTVGTFSR